MKVNASIQTYVFFRLIKEVTMRSLLTLVCKCYDVVAIRIFFSICNVIYVFSFHLNNELNPSVLLTQIGVRKGIQPVKSLAPAIHSRSFFEDLFQLTLHMGLTTVQCYRAACDYLLQPRKLFEQSTVEARSKARGLQGESQEIGRA